jgi:hypothetical protein
LPHFEPWHVRPPNDGPHRASEETGCDGAAGAEDAREELLDTTTTRELEEGREDVEVVRTLAFVAEEDGEQVPKLGLHPSPHYKRLHVSLYCLFL